MRSVTDPTMFVAKTTLTRFVVEHLPPLISGLVLGTLFIASVGTGAGLALGISTVLDRDIIRRYTRKFDSEKESKLLQRALILVILLLGCALSSGSLGDIILNFAFLSMGLRGAVIFSPLIGALWLKGKIEPIYAVAAIVAGPLMVILGTAAGLSIDPLIISIAITLLIRAMGLAFSRRSD